MNILLIDQYAGSPALGMEYRPFFLSKYWAKAGHRVLILAGCWSHLRRENPAPGFYLEEGVRFRFLRTPKYRGNGAARAANVFSFAAGLSAPGLLGGFCPDVVIDSSTHPFAFRQSRRIARRFGAKLVFELHDLWPLSPIELYGFSENHPLMRLIWRREREAFTQSDLVVSILPFCQKFLQEKGLGSVRALHIPNGIDEQQHGEVLPEEHRAAIAQIRKDFPFLVLYAGGFSEANAVSDLPELALALPGAAVAAAGNGPGADWLRGRAAQIKNFFVLPPVPYASVASLLAEADCLFLSAKANGIDRYGVAMNKLFDYLLAARPVVFACNQPSNPVADSGCGATVPAGNPAAAADAIRRLMALSPGERALLGSRGREYACAHHSYRIISAQFQSAMEGLFNETKKTG